MKIKRFNESYNGDKIIKKYYNSILHEYYIDVDELTKSKDNILKLINEYVEINKEHFSNKYWRNYSPDKISGFDFFIDPENNQPVLSLWCYRPEDKFFLIYKDIEGVLNFLGNPDLYRNKIKYNI